MAHSTSTKGQAYLTDFVVGMSIFSAVLILFGALWNASLHQTEVDMDVAEKQNDYVFSLLKTDGYNSSGTYIPGLVESGQLKPEKFLYLKNLSRQEKRRVFRTHGYILEVQGLEGEVIEAGGEELSDRTGNMPEGKSVYSSREIVAVDKNSSLVRAELVYYSWDE